MNFEFRRNAEFQIRSTKHIERKLHIFNVVHVVRHVNMLRQHLLLINFFVLFGLHVKAVEFIRHERFRETFRREVHRRKSHRAMAIETEAAHFLFCKNNRFAFHRGDCRIFVQTNQLIIRRKRRRHNLVTPIRALEELELSLVNDPEAALFFHHEIIHFHGAKIFSNIVLDHEHSLCKAHLSRHINISRSNCSRLLEHERIFRQSININHGF